MDLDMEKAEEMALAFLYMNLMRDGEILRAWKTIPWEIMGRLHDREFISDPAAKAKSVRVNDAGVEAARAMFKKYLVEASP